MTNSIENLVAAADRIAAREAEPNRCQWCNSEIDHDLGYCEGTDCEYDGEKWRRAHR